MKKILNLLLVFCMLLTSVSSVLAADSWTARTNSVDLRIGIIGDTHAGTNQTSQFTNNLDAHKVIGGEKLDGLILTGDIIYQEDAVDATLYDGIVSALNASSLPYVFAMGNHEYPLHGNSADVTAASHAAFEEKTGKGVINTTEFGTEDDKYYAIAAAAEDYAGHVSAETEATLKIEIDKAIAASSTNKNANGGFDAGVIPDSEKPVFVALHHPIDGTMFNESGPSDGERGYSEDFVAYLKTRPQVIVLTGHRHIPEQLPGTIWQDGFTVYQTAVSAGGTLVAQDCDVGDASGESQSSMIEVKDNVVSIIKLDLKNKEYIGEPWTIDIPSIVADRTDTDTSNDNDHYLYSADKRANPVAPYFPSNAEVSVSVTNDISVSIKWPNSAIMDGETPNQQDGFVRGYKAEIVDNETSAVVASKTYQTEFYKAAQSENFIYDLNLNYNKTYTAKIYPMGGLGNFGRPITKVFKTNSETLPNGAQRIEYDEVNDGTFKRTTDPYVGAGSNGAIIGSLGTANPNTANDYYSIPFNVTVEKDGLYELSTVLQQKNDANYSVAELYFGTDSLENVLTNDTSYAEDLKGAGYYAQILGTSLADMRLYKTTKELTAGTYNVELRVWELQSSGAYNGKVTFGADYFQIAPTTKYPTVTDESSVKIEYESYSETASFKRDASGASGGVIIGSLGGKKEIEQYTLTTRISIPADGKYDVTFVAKAKDDDPTNKSDVTVSLYTVAEDGTEPQEIAIGTNYGTYISESGISDSKFPDMYVYGKKNIELTAGDYDVTTVIYDTDKTPKQYYFGLDYIEIKTPEKINISGGADTYFELEDYADLSTSGSNDVVEYGEAHGGYFMKDSSSVVDPSAEIPVYIEASGYYDIEYVAGKWAGSTSEITFSLGDTVLGTNRDDNSDGVENNGNKYTVLSAEYTGKSTTNPDIAKFIKEKIWLDRGSNVLTVVYSSASSSTDLWKYNVDYIAFKPCQRPVISVTSSMRLEFEEYMTETNVDGTGNNEIIVDSAASGGQYVQDNWSMSDPSICVPVKIAESGYYDVEYIISYATDTKSYGSVELYMGEEKIGDSIEATGTEITYTNTGKKPVGIPLHKYVKTMWLDEGFNLFKMNVNGTNSNTVFKYRADYIQIAPSEGLSVSGSKVSVTSSYDETVSGKAVLALYDADGNLISVKIGDVTELSVVVMETEEKNNFAKAVIYVWDSFNNLTPQADAKIFSYN